MLKSDYTEVSSVPPVGYSLEPIFNHSDRKYLCCCGRIHVSTGTQFLSFFAIFFSMGLYILELMYSSDQDQYDHRYWVVRSLIEACHVIVFMMTIYGTHFGRASYLLPFLGVMGFTLAAMLIVIAFAIVRAKYEIAALLALTLLVQVKYYDVVLQCYHYIKEAAAFGAGTAPRPEPMNEEQKPMATSITDPENPAESWL